MDACLEEHGHPEWDWSLSRGYADPYDPLSRTEWFADLGRRIYSENEIAAHDYLAAEAVMNSDEPRNEKYEQAIDACLASTDQPSESEVDSAGQPNGAQELIEAWRSVMATAGTEHGGSLDTYYECIDEAKIPVLEAAERPYEDIAQVMGREAAQAPAPGQDPATYSEAWNEFLATEDQVLEADIACREDVYAHGIPAMGPVIADFESQNADEIARAHAGWDEIVAKAAGLGYTGQRGPLGK